MKKLILFAIIFELVCDLGNAFDQLNHKIRSIEFWGSYKDVPIEKKLDSKMSAELLEYLKEDNISSGWPIPVPATPDKQFKDELKLSLMELSAPFLKTINSQLLGIYFVKNLGTTGYTEYVKDKSGNPIAGFIILDISALNRTANEWASWKESSPFLLRDNVKISATIEEEKFDNRRNAIQYVLLHEFGHILSIGNPLMPIWGVSPSDLKIVPQMKFFSLSWILKENKFESKFDDAWSGRNHTRYYAASENKNPNDFLIPDYQSLSKTNFPNLYAATSPFDDFAESIANYIHVVILKKPWQVEISTETQSFVLKSCWLESRCREKKELIEEILQRGSSRL